ncbi:DUF2784 family protein [Gordonia jinghuaiqii]|uniref:DUF2784 domain-containing protein n=1 Tax=Gordonia jinghuaiqii TaxID=2758710 RepID=A0A7D7RPB0_9ACTN|nr:DUF2784 domain-containing protein [Gordonia jinghuaiqii]MCR5979243.1 DUF2784 family protein [Gordonia jinghuaiqii]QMT01033.1 DUF2784 domain-containing protein [Gordonia jinghuaiqii]
MPYRVLADGIAVSHLLFLLYVTVGGFVAWRWPWTMVLHLATVAWGSPRCWWEWNVHSPTPRTGPAVAPGEKGLPPAGFIDHYLTGVIYPDSALGVVRMLVAACVVAWVGLWWRLPRRRTGARHRIADSGQQRYL